MYQLKTLISLPSELILSLYSFQCPKAHKSLSLGPDWVKQTSAKLSSDCREELKKAGMSGDWETLLLIAYVYLTQHSNALPEEFISFLETIRIGDLYEMLSPYTNTFPVDLDTERQHFRRILAMWNEEYFSKCKEEVTNNLLKDLEARGNVQTVSNPTEMAEVITNGLFFEPLEDLEEIVLIPQYHYRPTNFTIPFRGVTICHYPIHIQEEDSDIPPYHIQMMTKSLSVDSRLRILKYLRSGPKKFTDVVNHIGLAKGVTHDHLLSLRRSGFVRTHVVGCTPNLYSLRENSIQRLAEELTEWLEL